MKNLLKSITDKKDELLSKISNGEAVDGSEKFNFHEFLISEGKVMYLPENFNFDHFSTDLVQFISETLKQKTKTESLSQNILKIEYNPAKGIMKSIGLGGHFVILITVFEKQLIYSLKTSDWFANPKKKEPVVDITGWVKDSCENEISKYIGTQIENEFISIDSYNKIDFNNKFIESIPSNVQTWFYSEHDDNELLLACLSVSEVKKMAEGDIPNSTLNYYYVITTESAMLLGFNQQGEISYHNDLSSTEITVKKEIGRDPVTAGDTEWLTTRSNDSHFAEVAQLILLSREDRMRNVARLNFLSGQRESATELLTLLCKDSSNQFDEFSLFYASFAGDKMNFVENADAEKLVGIITQIIDSPETATKLTEWTKKWEISHINKAALMKVFTETAVSKEQEQRILPFHREVFAEFLKKEKDPINRMLAEITFARNLINAGENDEAIQLLENSTQQLPDETLSELLPSEHSDLTGESGGQMLRVTFYELLIQASSGADTKKYTHKIAELQPLSKKRLQQLADIKLESKSAKAEQLLKILSPKGLEQIIGDDNAERKAIPEKMFETFLRHPATRQSGTLYSVQKWLSKIEVPDHSSVKSFSDTLESKDYPVAYDVVKEVKKMFGKYETEFFVARGEKSTGIIGFEGSPEFILVGNKHLDKDSEFYLTPKELKFAISCEMAHLYYKHSKITSSDIWRGAMQKSFIFADSVLSFVPVAGFLGKSIQSLGKLASIASVLKSAEKLTVAKDILDAGSKMTEIYGTISKKDSNNEKEQEILAVSRAMQLTADRAGLLFSGDITAAVRTIFMDSENFLRHRNEAQEHGLENFILQKNNDGTYKHQHLAVRFASLFSFYLSWDYAELVKIMEA